MYEVICNLISENILYKIKIFIINFLKLNLNFLEYFLYSFLRYPFPSPPCLVQFLIYVLYILNYTSISKKKKLNK